MTNSESIGTDMTLKPCPFCGFAKVAVFSADEIEHVDEDDERHRDTFAACCDFNAGGCGATGGYRETREEAQQIWEQRA